MTALNHKFENDFSSQDSEEPAVELSSRWLDRLSVEKKLGFAVLGNTLVLAFLVSLILFASWFFTETGREHSISNAVEARSNNAVVALYDALENAEAADNASSQAQRDQALFQSNEALILAVALLNEPLAQATTSLPEDYAATYIDLRDDVQALQLQVDASRERALVWSICGPT